MRALRVVSRVVTSLYILSFVSLVLTAGAWREMAGIATYAFLVLLVVGVLMSAIEWRWGGAVVKGTSPRAVWGVAVNSGTRRCALSFRAQEIGRGLSNARRL